MLERTLTLDFSSLLYRSALYCLFWTCEAEYFDFRDFFLNLEISHFRKGYTCSGDFFHWHWEVMPMINHLMRLWLWMSGRLLRLRHQSICGFEKLVGLENQPPSVFADLFRLQSSNFTQKQDPNSILSVSWEILEGIRGTLILDPSATEDGLSCHFHASCFRCKRICPSRGCQ